MRVRSAQKSPSLWLWKPNTVQVLPGRPHTHSHTCTRMHTQCECAKTTLSSVGWLCASLSISRSLSHTTDIIWFFGNNMWYLIVLSLSSHTRTDTLSYCISTHHSVTLQFVFLNFLAQLCVQVCVCVWSCQCVYSLKRDAFQALSHPVQRRAVGV